MILAAWYHTILAFFFAVICILLMIVILLQRGKGVGLAGAFGGAGGASAFGAKTGDVLTWVTVVGAGILLTYSVALNFVFQDTAPNLAPPAPMMPGMPPPAAPGGPAGATGTEPPSQVPMQALPTTPPAGQEPAPGDQSSPPPTGEQAPAPQPTDQQAPAQQPAGEQAPAPPTEPPPAQPSGSGG